jgi:hypothetical protein
MSLSHAIKEYGRLVQEVFSDKKAVGTSGSSTYKGTKLRETLKSIVRDTTGNADERMIESQEKGDGCKT